MVVNIPLLSIIERGFPPLFIGFPPLLKEGFHHYRVINHPFGGFSDFFPTVFHHLRPVSCTERVEMLFLVSSHGGFENLWPLK
jgi:hypothetical protein